MKYLQKLALLFLVSTALHGAPASATPMDDLKKAGYSCERGGVDSIVCTKDGSPTKYCDNSGNCTRTTAGGKLGTFAAPKSRTAVMQQN